jgi:hypothetical protein
MLLVMATYPRTHRTGSELIVRWIDAYDLFGCELGDEAPNFWGAVRVHALRRPQGNNGVMLRCGQMEGIHELRHGPTGSDNIAYYQ